MTAYYRGNAAYREKGPPALALRILGPFLVSLTMLLFLSPLTVKTHVSRILTKLRARDRVQLVVIAYQAGLVST